MQKNGDREDGDFVLGEGGEVCVGERGSFTLASFIGGEFFCSGSEARLSDYFICVNIFN